jgi:ABC-type branched-subunit amino acid transport system substrate-binding protein
VIATLKTIIVCLALAPMAATSLRAGGGAADPFRALAQESAEQARPMTPQERRGRAIYLHGQPASGREIPALVGDVDVPASTVTCAGCHGTRGEGKTEGGVTAVNLTWAHLLKPYGHTHSTGRKHGPFDEAAFARAVTGGVDPGGNALHVAMPRYRMSAEDMADLIAYLKRIESERDPGLSETSLTVGAVLPTQGALADIGAAIKDALTAYFTEINIRGGIYNRKIELRFHDSGDAAASVAAARASVQQEKVFALVGSLSAGAERELATLAREGEIPVVGAATLLPQIEAPPNRYVFYVLPGVVEQARALVNFASSQPGVTGPRAVILHAETELASSAASAAQDQARQSGWGTLARQSYGRGDLGAARIVNELRLRGFGAVFLFGSGREEAAVIQEAAAQGWSPQFFLVGALSGRNLADAVPPAFNGRVFLAFPTVPADVTPAGLAELRALSDEYNFAPRHTASQLSALAAAKIFVEGLTRAGRDVTREKLVVALEGLYDFETGVTPRVTFGSNRRVGAMGAYVVTIDTEKREFAVASRWVSAE